MKFPFPALVIGTVVVLLATATYFMTGNEEPSLQTDSAATDSTTQTVERDTTIAANDMGTQEVAQAPYGEAAVTEPVTAERSVDPNLIQPPAELNNSDSKVLESLRHFAPDLSKWLIPDEQIRKWVLAVDLIADGKLPKRYLPIDYPMDKFAVETVNDKMVMAEKNYERVVPLIETLTAVDVKLLADYYHAWQPLLEKAYREQGKPGTFNDRFNTALDNLIAVTPLIEREALVRPRVLYQYQNEQWEEATDLEKLLWRMGEDNTLNLQAFARSLRFEINQ